MFADPDLRGKCRVQVSDAYSLCTERSSAFVEGLDPLLTESLAPDRCKGYVRDGRELHGVVVPLSRSEGGYTRPGWIAQLAWMLLQPSAVGGTGQERQAKQEKNRRDYPAPGSFGE